MVTLQGPILCYHDETDINAVVKNNGSMKPRGRLNLKKEDTIAEMHTRKTEAPTAYLLTVNIYLFGGGKKKWEMSCVDQQQQSEWYNAIRKYDGEATATNNVVRKPFIQKQNAKNNKHPKNDATNTLQNLPSASHRGSLLSQGKFTKEPSQTPTEHYDSTESFPPYSVSFTSVWTIDVLMAFGVMNASVYYIVRSQYPVWIAFLPLNMAAYYLLTKLPNQSDAVPIHNAHATSKNSSRAPPSSSFIRSLSFQTQSSKPATVVNPPKNRIYSFQTTVPAGTTLKRATVKSATDLEKTIINHGESSVQAIRAYASSTPTIDYEDVNCSHCYWNLKPSEFNLRIGPNYKKNKRKGPSIEALYDIVAVDFVRAASVLNQSSDGFTPPSIPGITDLPSTGHKYVPPMLVFNTWLPDEEPSVFQKKLDGPSFVCVMYYVITQDTLDQLKDLSKASPAVQLFAEWCEKAEHDYEFRSRLKFMGAVEDIEKTGIPSFISVKNGKPVLIKQSGRFTRYPNYIEMSVNVWCWSFIAKKALITLMPKFPNLVVNVGITIEGRKDEELPETLLGGCRLMRLDPNKVATNTSQ